MNTKLLKCHKCDNEQEIEIEYRKEFWTCNKCNSVNVCTHYVDECYGISKQDSLLLSALGKRRYQPK